MSHAKLISALGVVAALVAGLLIVRTCTAQEGESPFVNVELLTHVKDKREMRAIMKEQAKALGVKCTYCHVQGKFELDDKEEKKTGRAMIRMVDELNAKYFPDAEQGITCWTCHRGSEKPELLRPPDAGGDEGFEAAE